jgi:hypothetical protein
MNIFLKFPRTTPNEVGKHYDLASIFIDNEENSQPAFRKLTQTIVSDFFVESKEFELSRNGIKLTESSSLSDGDCIQISPFTLGGKGGFGSLLRSFGKQITLSTNKDACRDLTGRRMKHVNNEKRLKEFMEKQIAMAKEKEEKKKEKALRRRQKLEQIESGGSNHVFLDPQYNQNREKINQDLEEALNKALKKEKLKRKKPHDHAKSSKEDADNNEDENSNDDEQTEAVSTTNTEPTASSTTPKSETAVVETKADVTASSNDFVDSKKTKDIATTKFKDWLGVGELEVSSSSDEEGEPQSNKSK